MNQKENRKKTKDKKEWCIEINEMTWTIQERRLQYRNENDVYFFNWLIKLIINKQNLKYQNIAYW